MMEQPTGPPPTDGFAELTQLLVSVLRRSLGYWPILLVSVLLGALAYWQVPRFHGPLYRSEIVLMIRETLETGTVLGTEGGAGESRRGRNARLQELMLARPNLRKIIEEERPYPATVARLGVTDAMEDLRLATRFNVGEGNTIVIAFEHGTPEIAQRVARRLGQSLVEQVGRDSAERAESTRKFLETEQAKALKDLQAKESEYAEFLTLHPEFALERSMGTGGPSRGSLRTELASPDTDPLHRQADRLRRRLDQIRNPGSGPAATPAATVAEPVLTPESREALGNAQRDVTRAREELEAKQTQYTAIHPDVVAAHARLAAAQERLKRIKAAAESYVPPSAPGPITVPARPGATRDMERELKIVESSIATQGSAKPRSGAAPSASGAAAAIVNLETRFTGLTRELTSMREQNESLQRRLFRAVMEATAASSGGGPKILVVEDAYLPRRPFRQGPRRTGSIAGAIVILLGGFVMLVLGYLDPRVVTEWDLRRLGAGQIALLVPRLRKLDRRQRDGS